jgi:NADPH:quinone reductase-like Zn-dependent oxidoreductase
MSSSAQRSPMRLRTAVVVLPAAGEPSVLRLEEREVGPPTEGQALVRVDATGISFAEQQMLRGKYYDQPPFPFVPGYDLVGTVVAVGDGVPGDLVHCRVAALTKTGAWAGAVVIDAADLVAVPDGLPPDEAATVVVNGLTAVQMLHRHARVRRGDTVLVHGANGGVGSTLVQLAVAAGARVIGTCSPRNAEAVTALGATPVDYHGDWPTRVRALAPEGVDAVFDHVGGRGLVDSWRLVRRGGALVSYGTAATKDDKGSSRLPVLLLLARVLWWNTVPNGRRASFFNVWAGAHRRPGDFRRRLAEDLGRVFQHLRDGTLTAQIAARLPLDRVVEAMTVAQSRTVVGKVVLLPPPPVAVPSPVEPTGEQSAA